MARTVLGFFDDRQKAQSTVEDLVNAGFPRDDISLVTRSAESATPTVERGASGTAVGIGTGAVLGGVGGLLLGLGVLAIPGIGPVLAAGPLATALAGAGIGAAAGGLLGALTDLGVPEEEAEYYAEGIRRGGTLVSVKVADEAAAERAAEIMDRYDPIDIEERAAHWREAGWTGWDPEARPYTAEDVRRETERYRSTSRPEVGELVRDTGVYGGMRDRQGRGVRAYVPLAGAAKADPASGIDAAEADYRMHFESVPGRARVTYEESVVAYRFGYDLEAGQQQRSVDWQSLEAEARRRWEERRPGTWDRLKEFVRYGWERARGRRAA